jgi:hypothetical protein
MKGKGTDKYQGTFRNILYIEPIACPVPPLTLNIMHKKY